MKKLLFITMVSLLCMQQLLAVVARPKSIVYVQPSGYSLECFLRGDEFFHFRTTVDKYVLLPDGDGTLTYATQDTLGELIPSGVVAHNEADRTVSEKNFLLTIRPNMAFGAKVKNAVRVRTSQKGIRKVKSMATRSVTTAKYLVILVNFSDNTFSVPNAQARYNDQFNGANYTTDGATGSVKQYFKDNSMGNFDPTFDVVGPVTMSKPMAYYGGNDTSGSDLHPEEMVFEACQLIDSQVNFADYDLNNDGVVDNVYVIYAGYGEASGAPANTIWPHAWEVTNTTKLDGKTISSYSCSNELQGTSGVLIDGIGTSCHEFSHTIGLPDLYDTDYEKNGQALDVDTWSLMAYGCYNNNGMTPPYYISIERELLGWGTATELTSASNLNLNSIATNQFYKISTKTPNEYYLLENRQLTGWDSFLYQHGLLVYHVDKSTAYASRWADNTINAYSDHQCADVVEADGTAVMYDGTNESAWLASVKGDPFPGTSGKTEFTDTSSPNAKSWSNVATEKPVTGIVDSNGVISFKFMGGMSTFGNYSALPATDITNNSFTSNWNEGTNATKYLLNVYKKSATGASSTTVNQGFDNFPGTVPTGYTVSVTTTYTSTGNFGALSPSVKLGATNASITTDTYADAIKTLSFWLKGNGTDATSSLLIEGSADKSTWTTIASLSALPTTGTTKTYTIDPAKNYRTLRMTYTKSVGNLAIDDISITYGKDIVKTNVLTDFPVTSGHSYSVTGLDNNGTYYYTVKAANVTETSPESNEVQVVLALTGLDQSAALKTRVFAEGSSLVVNATSEVPVRIYSVMGQLLVNRVVQPGVTKIPMQGNQVYIIKSESSVVKIMIP
jgi:M6 family metalloprotease-like protein